MSNDEFVNLIKEIIYNKGFIDTDKNNFFTKKDSKQAPTQQIMINGQLIHQQPQIISIDYNIEIYNESIIEDEESSIPFILIDFSTYINNNLQNRQVVSIYYDELGLFEKLLNEILN